MYVMAMPNITRKTMAVKQLICITPRRLKRDITGIDITAIMKLTQPAPIVAYWEFFSDSPAL